TISFICNVFDPVTGKRYPRDPRFVTQKAIEYLKSTGIADTCFIGPEAEFFIFDDVRYQINPNSCSYSVDSMEAAWNTGREEFPNLGHKPGYKGGYFPVA